MGWLQHLPITGALRIVSAIYAVRCWTAVKLSKTDGWPKNNPPDAFLRSRPRLPARPGLAGQPSRFMPSDTPRRAGGLMSWAASKAVGCRRRRKMGPLWQGEKGQRRVTRWPTAGATAPGVKRRRFLGGMAFRSFGLLGAIGLPFDLQDNRPFNQTVEEGHRQRTIGEIVSPFIEVHVSDHSRGALLIARGDDLIEQVRRLQTFDALDFVKPEFVNKC
jgi:hypothetical protein